MNININSSIINKFFSNLGLSEDEINIYLTLTKKGVLTILELSKETKINRTNIYRLVEELSRKGAIEEIIDKNRTLLKAVNIDKLSLIINEKESQIEFLKKIFPQVENILNRSCSFTEPESKILFYKGTESIRKMSLNTLKASNEILGYTYKKYSEIVGMGFDNNWNKQMKMKRINFREIYSDNFLKSLTNFERIKIKQALDMKLEYPSRYISSEILDINHQINIYNDIVCHYNWYEGEIFGIEIHNKKIANMERQLFEIVWKSLESLN